MCGNLCSKLDLLEVLQYFKLKDIHALRRTFLYHKTMDFFPVQAEIGIDEVKQRMIYL